MRLPWRRPCVSGNAGQAKEVLVVSIGPADCQQQLRTGLAMGADRAILIESNQETEPLVAARVLLKIVTNASRPTGHSSASRPSTTTAIKPARCWRPLGRPQATFASKLEIADGTPR